MGNAEGKMRNGMCGATVIGRDSLTHIQYRITIHLSLIMYSNFADLRLWSFSNRRHDLALILLCILPGNLWCRGMFGFGCQQYMFSIVYVGCCWLCYIYMSLIYGEYFVNIVHFSDIPHTFIPHFILHSTEKNASNSPQITGWQLSAFCIPQNSTQLNSTSIYGRRC